MQQQNSTDGTLGTGGAIDTDSADSTDGTDGANDTGIDLEARRRFVSGAKVGKVRGRKPWDQYDPDEAADKGMNLRTNRYERALLRHASALKDGGSMQQTIRELIREGALARIERGQG